MKNNVELLAPVGSEESLYAAIQNGANAVYLGGKLFNARYFASNFDNEGLREAINYAHLRNVKVYVTVNTLVDDVEMDELLDYIKFLYDIDVDAIIVQDLGFAHIIKNLLPKLELHGSTQMTINNLYGVEFLEGMDFSRVVLARETPIDEISHISKKTSMELEAFIHGALCVSYSGQCLMSSMIGGRSGNRGMCAQPCRMKYSILDRNGNLVKDWDKVHALSPKDLNTLDHIEDLIQNGIHSLKIEGRMKRPEYVATVVNAYRKVIDKGINSLDLEDKKDVEQIFNRGFTKGLTFGDFGRSFISPDRPDNRGLLLGKVIRADKYKVYIELQEDINQGDGMEFLLKSGEYKGMKVPFDAKKGSTIHLEKPGYIEVGTNVYRTSSQRLLNKAKDSFVNKEIKYKIDMEFEGHIASKPRLLIKYKDLLVESIGDKPIEKSQKVAISEEKIGEHLSKLGDTTFELNNLKINLDKDVFLPLSSINSLRRDSIEILNQKVRDKYKRNPIPDDDFTREKPKYFKFSNKSVPNNRLTIMVKNLEQFNKLDLNKLDRVYLGFTQGLEQPVSRIKEHGKEAYLWTDKILYNKDLNEIKDIIKSTGNLDGVSVSNLGSLKYFKDRLDLDIHGDIGLNVFNSFTVDYLKSLDLNSMTLSPELNLTQIGKITDNVGGNLETIVYGYLPVMVMKNCPMALVKGCKDDKECNTCNFATGYGLKDRMGVTFKMDRSKGISTIYNSVPLMVLDSLESIKKAGVDMFRLDFTNELSYIGDVQRYFYDYLNGNKDINEVRDFMQKFKQETFITNGHYFRGIL